MRISTAMDYDGCESRRYTTMCRFSGSAAKRTQSLFSSMVPTMSYSKGEENLRSRGLLHEIRRWLCKSWEGKVVDSGAVRKYFE